MRRKKRICTSKKKEDGKKKAGVEEQEEEEEEEMRAKFLSIVIMVHFNFYQSQRDLRRLAGYIGTHTNMDVHVDI